MRICDIGASVHMIPSAVTIYDIKPCSTKGVKVASGVFLRIEGRISLNVVLRFKGNKRGQKCHDCLLERHHCSMMNCSSQFAATRTHVMLPECLGK